MRKRGVSKPDRLITASLHGILSRHCRGGWSLTDAQREAALAEIHEQTTMPDLLAEVAELRLGFYGDQTAYDFLVEAGANTALIPAWVEEGKRRRNKPQHSAP